MKRILVVGEDALCCALGERLVAADEESDPKRLVLSLVRRSRERLFRNEVISVTDPSKPGTGYNLHLGAFVRTLWNAQRGAQCSPSLARALKRVQALDTIQG